MRRPIRHTLIRGAAVFRHRAWVASCHQAEQCGVRHSKLPQATVASLVVNSAPGRLPRVPAQLRCM